MQILSDSPFKYTSIKINFMHAIPHVLSSVKSSVKGLATYRPLQDSRMVRAAHSKAKGRWFDSRRRHVFSFWIFRFPLLTIWRSLYKWKQAWNSFRVMDARKWVQYLKNMVVVIYDGTALSQRNHSDDTKTYDIVYSTLSILQKLFQKKEHLLLITGVVFD